MRMLYNKNRNGRDTRMHYFYYIVYEREEQEVILQNEFKR